MENVPHLYVKKIEIFNEIYPFSIVMFTLLECFQQVQGITCFLSSRIGMLIAMWKVTIPSTQKIGEVRRDAKLIDVKVEPSWSF